MTQALKLNVTIRDEILNKVLDKTIRVKVDEKRKEIEALGLKIYDDIVTEEHKTLIAKLPKCYFTYSQQLTVEMEMRNKYSGDHIYMGVRFMLPNYRVITKLGYEDTKRYSREHEFAKKYWKLNEELDELLREESSMRREIATVLKSVTTIKRLIEVWPDVEQYIPKEFLEGKKNLPALRLDDLNKKLSKYKKAA